MRKKLVDLSPSQQETVLKMADTKGDRSLPLEIKELIDENFSSYHESWRNIFKEFVLNCFMIHFDRNYNITTNSDGVITAVIPVVPRHDEHVPKLDTAPEEKTAEEPQEEKTLTEDIEDVVDETIDEVVDGLSADVDDVEEVDVVEEKPQSKQRNKRRKQIMTGGPNFDGVVKLAIPIIVKKAWPLVRNRVLAKTGSSELAKEVVDTVAEQLGEVLENKLQIDIDGDGNIGEVTIVDSEEESEATDATP